MPRRRGAPARARGAWTDAGGRLVDDLDTFASALRDGGETLNGLVGPRDIVRTAPGLRSVAVVESGTGGTQTLRIAFVSETGPGSFDVRTRIPGSFPVRHVSDDGERFTLTSDDGRSVLGTPRQFRSLAEVRILNREYNPSYERHAEEAFLATHLLPDGRSLPPRLRTDAVLGEIRLHDALREYESTVRVGGGETRWAFDSAGPERVAALLPRVRALVASFDRVLHDGLEFLWTWGADGAGPEEEAEERSRFLEETAPPSDVVVYRSGDFEVHFGGAGGGRSFMDGYWPAVHFRSDTTPVGVSVQA
ncbi:hypothetical protein ACIBFB_00100 [Nocardiopsis sp. NPDC050513]|uniref:hypothetical protein n=1 Tax=Nocardiopsis sp. NPDC050513 TaxID=3364338 RepID=UPI00379F0E7B